MAEVISSVRTALIGVILILVLRWRPEGIVRERPVTIPVRR
jgi:ABC-type branched-subunit amino acid transport system permease subunit